MLGSLARRHAVGIGAYALAAAVFVVAIAYQPSFTGAANLSQVLVFASFIGFAALGQTFVILGGGMDLSVPWTIAIGGVLLSHLTGEGMDPAAAIAIVLGAGALVGLINGIGVAGLGISPIVMTLGMGGLIQGYLLKVGLNQASGTGVPKVATSIASGHIFGVPTLAFVWLAVAVVAGLVLGRTAFGRRLYAVGMNDRAATLAGVRSRRVRALTYVVSGVASVFAGIVLAGYVGQAYLEMGSPYLFGSIAAVAVGGASIRGGRGSYWGSVAGALTLTFLSFLLPILNLKESALDIVYGIVILAGVSLSRGATALAGRTRQAPEKAPRSKEGVS
jgi:ribose transport system permease protein